jgi:hypothetical protein
LNSYLEEAAGLIRAELAADAEPPANSESLFVLYAVLMRAKGESVTLADVHDAWSAWAVITQPGHKSLVPFQDLDPETQEADRPYAEAIRRAARRQ